MSQRGPLFLMPELELEDSQHKTFVECDSGTLPSNDAEIHRLIAQLQLLYQAVPIVQFTVTKDVPEVGKYTYKWTTVDARIWKQVIWAEGDHLRQTFDEVMDDWADGEFVPHREIRNIVKSLILNRGLVKIVYDRK